MCPLWWKSSYELQGMCGLQIATKDNISTSPFKTTHSSRTIQTNPIHLTRSNICSNNQTTFLRSHKCRTSAIHKPTSSTNQQYTKQTNNKLHGLSQRANYTDRATAACRRSECQLLRKEGATWSAWRIPTAVFSVFWAGAAIFISSSSSVVLTRLSGPPCQTHYFFISDIQGKKYMMKSLFLSKWELW
jgi:hypothetical protein